MLLQERQSVSDIELVNLVRAGDTALYELLMRRYNQRLYRVIRSVIVNDVDAEDVLQEAWVRAYEHLDQFEGRASFSTWVTRSPFMKRWREPAKPGGGYRSKTSRERSCPKRNAG